MNNALRTLCELEAVFARASALLKGIKNSSSLAFFQAISDSIQTVRVLNQEIHGLIQK